MQFIKVVVIINEDCTDSSKSSENKKVDNLAWMCRILSRHSMLFYSI